MEKSTIRRSSGISDSELLPEVIRPDATRETAENNDENANNNNNNHHHHHHHIDNTESRRSIATRKKTISQYCAICASSMLTLSYGLSIGFSTILIGELTGKNPEIVVSKDELTWISSMNYFCIPLGAVVSGPITHYFGRRNSLILANVPYIISWLLFRFFGTNVPMILIGFLLLGITGGIIEAPSQIYVTEISEPRLRGSISITVSASIMLGIFLQVLMGTGVHWRTLAFLNIIVPIFAIIILRQVPESPYWLAEQGDAKAAESALCWLRGWTTADKVKKEYENILKSAKKSKDTRSTTILSVAKRFLHRSVYLPFLLVTFAFFISNFNGSTAMITYAVPVFTNFTSTSDEDVSQNLAVVLTGMQLLAGITMIFIIPRIGKRMPTLVSLIFTGVSMLTVAVYANLLDNGVIDRDNVFSWLPSGAVIFSIIASSPGIKSIPWILAGEVFPGDVRGVAAGLVGSTCNIYAAVASKIYVYMLDSLTLPGTFYTFAAVNFVGLVTLYFALPETEGRTLEQLEEHFSGGRKWSDEDRLRIVEMDGVRVGEGSNDVGANESAVVER